MPKVSIIIPVYNAEKSLRTCVESVLKQEYTDFELFLMDDGSSDGSPAICDEYAERDERVKVVHKPNSGVSATRNQALDMASGEYVEFLDADDWITFDATKLLVRAMEDHDVDMVIADFYRVVGERVSQKGSIDQEQRITRERYADEMMMSPADFYYGVIWNKLFRRSILEEHHIRMDENLSWCEDFIFNMEYILHTKWIYVLKAPIYYYVKTEGSLVAKSAGFGKAIRMKLNVIEYYSQFYREIYNDEDYAVRRPIIYGFLLNVSKDGMAIPLMPGTERLGDEITTVNKDILFRDSRLSLHFYENRLFEHYMDVLAAQFDLDSRDILVFTFLSQAGTECNRRDVEDFTGLSGFSVMSSIQKLRMRKYLVPEEEKDEASDRRSWRVFTRDRSEEEEDAAAENRRSRDRKEKEKTLGLRIGEEGDKLLEAIDRMAEDFEGLQLSGFSEEEKETARGYADRAVQSIRRVLAR